MRRLFEGKAAVIRGESISVTTKPNRRRGKHKGQITKAKGDIEIEITKQFTISEASENRPAKGTVLRGDKATVNSRWRGKVRRNKSSGKEEVDVDEGFDAEVECYENHRFGRRRK